MTLNSINETVAILYDIENAPFEMLNYTLGKARRFQPCRTIVVSDWEARPEQKRWDKLMRRPGFTFRQISRTYLGKNSLDSAIYDSAKLLYDEGVRKFLIITTDSDFVRIAELLNSETPSYIIGVGTKQASETLRNAYNEFFVYPAEEKSTVKKEKTTKETTGATKKTKEMREEPAIAAPEQKAQNTKTVKPAKKAKTLKAAKSDKAEGKETSSGQTKVEQTQKKAKLVKAVKAAKPEKSGQKEKNIKQPEKQQAKVEAPTAAAVKQTAEGSLTVRLPKTLRKSLEARCQEEEVSLNELVTYLIMRGLSH